MSLISDALRKARQEAAEREAVERAKTVPPVVLEASGRFGTGVVVGAVIAVLATAVGAFAVWMTLGRSAPPAKVEAAVAVARTETAVPTTVGGASEADAGPPAAPSAGQDPVSTPSEPSPVGGAGAPEPAPVPVPGASGPEGGGGESELPARSESTAEARAVPAPARVRDFVIDARLGDVTLSLGLLVYRSMDPWAEINGREVHVGSKVDGFEVEAIEKDLVRLRDGRGPLVLRVRPARAAASAVVGEVSEPPPGRAAGPVDLRSLAEAAGLDPSRFAVAFSIGDRARVSTDGAANLRQDPNGALLAVVSGGTVVTVAGVPVLTQGRNDTIAWWPVELDDGRRGWLVGNTSSRTMLWAAD